MLGCSRTLYRVTASTSLLEQEVPMEEVQYLAGHAEPRTTPYDRRKRKVTRNMSSGFQFEARGDEGPR
jgi:hypothetical protein